MEIALLSDCTYLHGSVIYKGSRRIALGCNRYKPTFKASDFNPSRTRISVHAEEQAIIRASGNDLRGSTIYSARSLRKNGKAGISKPCCNCSRLISIAEISWVVYFDGKDIVKERWA